MTINTPCDLNSDTNTCSDDDFCSNMRCALPVGKHPEGDPDAPPISGLEYLRRVRVETSTIPVLVSVTLSPSLPPMQCTSFHEPLFETLPSFSLSWAERMCYRFEKLQERVLKARHQHQHDDLPLDFPHLKNQTAWSQYFHTTHFQGKLTAQLLTHLPRPIVFDFLTWHLNACHSQCPVTEFYKRCQSMYTLFLAIDPLLTATEIGALRDIGKKCQLLWFHHPQAQEIHPPLAMLFSVLASPFGQLDLCEFMEDEDLLN